MRCPKALKRVLHPHRKSYWDRKISVFPACQQAVCLISVMVGSRLLICWFLEGLLLFYTVVVCHLKWHCQAILVRACDWISKSSLAALLSLTVSSTHTHTHTPLNLDSKMTHSFYSLHRCKGFLPSFLGLLEEGEHILASCSEGLCSTCPHPSPSFFCLVPLCPSSSTLICHHPTHIFLSHIQSIVPCTT